MRESKKNQKSKWTFKVFVGLLMLCLMTFTNAGITKAAGTGLNNPVIDKSGVTTWDCIWFGNYYQSSKTKKEPIKWRVLKVSGNEALLLADVNLDCLPYNDTYDYVTWEDCSLRAWLNKDFLNAAFSSQEKLAIKTVTNTTDISPHSNFTQAYGGNDTKDQIFCLAWDDLDNPAYGFPENEGKSKARAARNSEYTVSRGATVSVNDGAEGNSWWWLRTPGYYNKCASFISHDGAYPEFSSGESGGISVTSSLPAVRPALYINLSRSVWTKANQVTSEDTESTTKSEEDEEPAGTDTASTDKNKITPTNSVANSAGTNKNIPTVKVDEKDLTISADFEKKTMNIKFKKVAKAVNYRIAYRKGGASKWNYAWSEGKNNYTLSKLKANQLIEFRIAGYAKIGGVWKRGKWSPISYRWFNSTTATTESIVKGFGIKVKKAKNATGYQVLYSTDKKITAALNKGKIEKLKAAQGGKNIKIRSLKKKTTYYIRWRAVRKYNGKTYLGIWNTVTKLKTK